MKLDSTNTTHNMWKWTFTASLIRGKVVVIENKHG